MEIGAIVLAGGRGSRLGGVDKGALRLDGATLLSRALDALRGMPIVVVGPSGSWWQAHPEVTVVREEPAFTGPAAAVIAGLGAVAPSVREVLLLAVDVPALPAVVPLLLQADADRDGVVALDAGGREQWLLARYRTEALRLAAARLGDPAGAPLGGLVGALRLARLPLGADLAGDVDTVTDAERAGIVLPAGEA